MDPTMGADSFMYAREHGSYLADKTMLIDRIIRDRGTKVHLFTRPRRFGKSINLTMLDAFFNIEHGDRDWFEGTEIAGHHEHDHLRNAFPVVYLNMKPMSLTVDGDLNGRFVVNASILYGNYAYLMKSDKLEDHEKKRMSKVLEMDIPDAMIPEVLLQLTQFLSKHHGTQTIVLIDEYDCLVQDHVGTPNYEQAKNLLKAVLSPLLKDNPHIYKAVLVGITQMAKEGMFSGLNNLRVSSIFDTAGYGEFFGMTHDDVRRACEDAGHPERFAEISRCYDGYRIGDTDIYNPLSVMSYFGNGMEPRRYWVNTSSDRVFEQLIGSHAPEVRDGIATLLGWGSIRTRVEGRLAFPRTERVEEMSADEAYTLLAQAGYLTAVRVADGVYDLKVPNREVMAELKDSVRRWFAGGGATIGRLARALVSGDADGAEKALATMVEESFNPRGASPRMAFQMFVAGMLSESGTHRVRVEHHSGDGVADIYMIPRGDGPRVVIEVKKVEAEGDADAEAEGALRQIRDKSYALDAPEPVLTYGMAIGLDSQRVLRGTRPYNTDGEMP